MMKANLKKYLQSLFIDASDTPNNDALFEELLGNLYDRYDELIGEGLTPDAAYARAIGDLGDISPLIEKGKKETTEEAIVNAMCEKYDADRDVIEKDVANIIEKMREAGFLHE